MFYYKFLLIFIDGCSIMLLLTILNPMKGIMNNKKAGRVTGILFVATTMVGVISTTFLSPINQSTFIQQIAENPNQLRIGIALVALMALGCAGIAISIYPVLSKYTKSLAIGAVGFRVIESAMFFVMCAALVTLSHLAPQTLIAQSATQDALIVSANNALLFHDGLSFSANLAFITGASLYHIGFYQTKLVPRWLSIWGLAGAVLYLTNSVLLLFGHEYIALYMPTAAQEMALAIWLIIKGFSSPKQISE